MALVRHRTPHGYRDHQPQPASAYLYMAAEAAPLRRPCRDRLRRYIVLISAVAWSTIKCEPPVNSYLPPAAGVGDRPSSQFESPGSRGREGSNRPKSGGNQNQPQDSYFPPSRTGLENNLDTQYGPPRGQASEQRPGGPPQFGPQTQAQGRFPGNNSPNSQYGVPSQDNNPSGQSGNQPPFSGSNNRRPTVGSFNSPSPNRGSSFGPDEPGFGERPDSSYGPPPSGNYVSPSSRGQGSQGPQRMNNSPYSVPNSEQTDGFGDKQSLRESPSSSYGAPGFGSDSGGRGSGSRGNFGSDESDEPAKYEFNYEVNDAQTGTKFGHSEQRDGDTATGEYNVELPDGRKQVVEYEAGLQGYKPQIRYEDNNRISQGGDQGYQQGGPGSSFPGSDNLFGFPQESQQSGRPGKYQQIPQGGPESSDRDFMGYPRTRPGESEPSIDFPVLGQKNFRNKPEYASGNHNRLESLNGGPQAGTGNNNEGYPRGGPGGRDGGNSKNGPGGRNGGSSRGMDEGLSRGGSGARDEDYPRRTPGGGDEGYPSGGPGNRNEVYSRGSPGSRDEGYPRGGPGGRDEGHPRGGPGTNGSGFGRKGSQGNNGNYPQDNNSANKGGYPSGRPQGRDGERGSEGYPSGAPNGPRGSGY
ncbi:resilin [Aphomia sociella]